MIDFTLQLALVAAAYLTIVTVLVMVVRRRSGPLERLRERLPWWAMPEDSDPDGRKLRIRPLAQLCLEYLIVGVVAGIAVAAAVVVLAPATASSLSSIVTPDDRRRLTVAAALGWMLIMINVVIAAQLIDALLPRESENPKKQFDRMGAGIGVLERLLVVLLTLTAGPANISLVIAAKSLARFRQLSKQGFAERYLVGTLASVTIALVSALVAQQIWIRIA